MIRGLLSLAIILFFSLSLQAQRADVEFGKNRLQFKSFDWRYYSTENFEIYFYDEGNEIARIGAEYLEEEFDRITDIIGYSSYYKTKIFLYLSVSDLQQSNVGVNDKTFNISGQTDFIRSQVEVAFPGTMEEYKTLLSFKVTEMLIEDMMYGGSLSEMFQSSYLLSLPEWFIPGAAAYVAEGWSVKMDDYIRDLMQEKKLKKVNNFEGEDAKRVGQSIWNYIAERYGQSYISNILNLTRIVRNEEKSIAGTIGISYKKFVADWVNYYGGHADFVIENYIFPDESSQVEDVKRKKYDLNNLRISPEGNFLAYSKNIRGRYKVVVRNISTGKEKTIFKSGFKVINQEVDENMPLLSWRDENTLGIIYTRYGKNWISLHNINSGNKIKKQLSRINQIKSFDIAINSSLAVVSAERNGNNDLYLVSLKRNSIKRITDDIYDDVDARFIPETSSIVFSSNRSTDSISTKGKTINDISSIYNIFIYNIDSTENTVYRVTNTLSKNINPVAPNASEVYFLSDQQGIFNLFKYDLENHLFYQVSNFASSINTFDISTDKRLFAFDIFYGQKENIHVIENYELDKNIFTTQTKRQQFINAKRVAKRIIDSRQKLKETELTNTEKQRESRAEGDGSSFLDQFEVDTTAFIDTDNYDFSREQASENVDAEPGDADEANQNGEDYIDTDNYVFDTDVVKSEKSTSFLSKYRKLREEKDLVGPLDYRTRFTADNVVTSFMIDPLMGLGLNFEVQMNDLLENHQFRGGIFAATDLKNSSIYAEYSLLKHILDFKLRYERDNISRSFTEISTQKYILNKIEGTVSLPFNVATKISLSPFFASTQYFEMDPAGYISQPGEPLTSTNTYLGGKAEMVYDNSTVTGLNEIKGFRGKIGIVHWEGLNTYDNSFSNFYIDLRNYQPIHREIVFATRAFYGRYWGPGRKRYLLGGVDNWLFNKTRSVAHPTAEKPEPDELGFKQLEDNSDILFLEYVTSLRGFDYNSFYGSNAALFNAEIRFPVIKYFYNGPITSNFLRNLQLIGFYDIGTAWTGPSPLATENSINTQNIKPGGSPFQATIQNFRNPFLQSYGFGARTVVLGYYMKFDLAYPIEDNVRKDLRLFVSFGYDF